MATFDYDVLIIGSGFNKAPVGVYFGRPAAQRPLAVYEVEVVDGDIRVRA